MTTDCISPFVTTTPVRTWAAAVLTCAAVAAPAAAQGTWVQPTLMLPRFGHAMGFDPVRLRTVVYGGVGPTATGPFLPETWEWNGARWQRQATSGPATAGPMAWDPASQHLLMIAGAPTAGLWEWDGVAWSARPGVNPVGGALLQAGGVVYRSQFVANGGILCGGRTDLSRWDPASQAFVPVTSLCSAQWGGFRFVEYAGQLALVSVQPATSGQVYVLTNSTTTPWQAIGSGVAPFVSVNPEVHWWSDTVRGHVHAINFDTSQHLRFNGSAWTVLPFDPRLPTTGFGGQHRVTFDAARAVAILQSAGETWEFDGAAWSRRDAGQSPPMWNAACMAFDAARGESVLFGGGDGGWSDQTWTWRGDRWRRRLPPLSPPARSDARMVYDSSRQTVVLFGGADFVGYFNDTWEWDGSTWTDRSPPPAARPPALNGVALAHLASSGRSVLFGGRSTGGVYSGQTWEWDGAAGTWTLLGPAVSPGPRGGSLMTCDPVRDLVVMYGGSSPNGGLNDTWEWDGATWTRATPPHDPGFVRHASQMVFDSDRGVAVTFVEGASGTMITWQYDGVDWSPVPAVGAPANAHLWAASYEAPRRQIVTWFENKPPLLYLPVAAGPYGAGCAGTGGLAPQLGVTGRLSLTLQQGRPQSLGLFAYGWRRSSVPFLGCNLLIEPIWTADFVLLDSSGTASRTLNVPVDLAGVLTVQGAVLDAAGPSGVAFSNAFEARF